MPTVAHCCCPGGAGDSLCVHWSACFAYVDMPLTVLFEFDDGSTVERVVTAAAGSSVSHGTECVESPPAGPCRVSIHGACLETVDDLVNISPGGTHVVTLVLRHKFSNGLVYSDDNGTCSLTTGGEPGTSCSWRGGYTYHEPDGIVAVDCPSPPSTYRDHIFGAVDNVHVEVLVRFVGFHDAVARFEAQKATSAWTASEYDCAGSGLGDAYCKPANNDPKFPDNPIPYRMWVTSNLDEVDQSAGCEAVAFDGSFTFASGWPPVWFGIGDGSVPGVFIVDDEGVRIGGCISSPAGFDVTYTVTE